MASISIGGTQLLGGGAPQFGGHPSTSGQEASVATYETMYRNSGPPATPPVTPNAVAAYKTVFGQSAYDRAQMSAGFASMNPGQIAKLQARTQSLPMVGTALGGGGLFGGASGASAFTTGLPGQSATDTTGYGPSLPSAKGMIGDALGWAGKHPEAILGGIGVIQGIVDRHKADKLQKEALDTARARDAEAAPLRTAGIAGVLDAMQHPVTPGAATGGYVDHGNPYGGGYTAPTAPTAPTAATGAPSPDASAVSLYPIDARRAAAARLRLKTVGSLAGTFGGG